MRLGLAFLLAAAALPARAQQGARAAEEARPVPQLILPGAPLGQAAGAAAPVLVLPQAGALVAPESRLIVPDAPKIVAPGPSIIAAARPMTEAEAAPARPLGQRELEALAKSLSPQGGGSEAEPSPAARGASLGAAFDGALAPEAGHWDELSESFAGPRAPSLAVTATAARSLIARLLPSLYRSVPARVAYDKSARPSTGHLWSEETGHLIEVAPSRADSRGEVASAFGLPGRARVQQKIEQLMEVAHETFHVVFDAVAGRRGDHAPHSAYSAMTEGFAVGGEQLLVERMLEQAPMLGLGPRDTMDLSALAAARREWLDLEDTHYAEGLIPFRRAYAAGGAQGLMAFAASLSARRMAEVPRSDPAYQLSLGDHELAAAYLGRDAAARGGLDAYAKAARGEALTPDEERAAAAVIERAGPDAWRRVFERTLLSDRRLRASGEAKSQGAWWEKAQAPEYSVEPAFALARLSPRAGIALSQFLAATIAEKGGAARLFGRPGPSPVLQAIAASAEALPWDAASRAAWDAGLTRWLLALN